MSVKSSKICSLAGGLVLVLGASGAYAGNVGVDLNVHIGGQPQQVVVPAPVPVPPPVRTVVVEEEDIDFVYPEPLGLYVAVGVPYDLVFVNNSYFLFRGGAWYRAPHHRGPWVTVRRGDLPPAIRRYKMERIRHYRDREYAVYRRDHDRYPGRHFRSGKEGWKEARKEQKEHWKEERKEHKERWKEERRAEREDRKEERHEHGRGHGRHDD